MTDFHFIPRHTLLLTGVTTDATPTEIYIDGQPGTRLVLDNNSVVAMTCNTVARRNTGSEVLGMIHLGVFKRDANASTLVQSGALVVTLNRADSAWTMVPTADTVHGAIQFIVTGEVGKTIQWRALVEVNVLP